MIAAAVSVRSAMLNEDGFTCNSTRAPGRRVARFMLRAITVHSPPCAASPCRFSGAELANWISLTMIVPAASSTAETIAVKRMREMTLARARTSCGFSEVVRLRIAVTTIAATMSMTLPKK